MNETHPVVDRYIARLEEGLAALTPAERADVVRDIRSHLAEAVAAGRPLDATIEALGPADDLARAYAVELLVNPRRPASRGAGLERFLKVAGLVAVGSIPTIVIVAVLGSVGVSFIASGFALVAAGIWALAADLPPWIRLTIDPVWAIVLGPVLGLVGALALKGLVLYIRFLARAVRAVLPKPA